MSYDHCKWCGGDGCLGCEGERRRDAEQKTRPIFTANINNSDDMKLLKSLNKSIIDGEDIQSILEKSVGASLIRYVRK